MATTGKCENWTPEFIRKNFAACLRTYCLSVLERTPQPLIDANPDLKAIQEGLNAGMLSIPLYTEPSTNGNNVWNFFPVEPPWDKYRSLASGEVGFTYNLRIISNDPPVGDARMPGSVNVGDYTKSNVAYNIYWPNGTGTMTAYSNTDFIDMYRITKSTAYGADHKIPDTPATDSEMTPLEMFTRDKGLDILNPYHMAYLPRPVFKIADLKTTDGTRTEEATGLQRWVNYSDGKVYAIKLAIFDAVTFEELEDKGPRKTLPSQEKANLITGANNVIDGTWEIGNLLSFDDSYTNSLVVKEFPDTGIVGYNQSINGIYIITGIKQDGVDVDDEPIYVLTYLTTEVFYARQDIRCRNYDRAPLQYDGPEYFTTPYKSISPTIEWLVKDWFVDNRPDYGFQSAPDLSPEDLEDETTEIDPNTIQNPNWDTNTSMDRPTRDKHKEFIGFANPGESYIPGGDRVNGSRTVFEYPQTDDERQEFAVYRHILSARLDAKFILDSAFPRYVIQPTTHMLEALTGLNFISFLCNYSRQRPYSIYSDEIEVEAKYIKVIKTGEELGEFISNDANISYSDTNDGYYTVDPFKYPDFSIVPVNFDSSPKVEQISTGSAFFVDLIDDPQVNLVTTGLNWYIDYETWGDGGGDREASSITKIRGTWTDVEFTIPARNTSPGPGDPNIDYLSASYTVVAVAAVTRERDAFFYVDDDVTKPVDTGSMLYQDAVNLGKKAQYDSMNYPDVEQGESASFILGEYSPGQTFTLSDVIGTAYKSQYGPFYNVTKMREILVDPDDDTYRYQEGTEYNGWSSWNGSLSINVAFYRKYNFDYT